MYLNNFTTHRHLSEWEIFEQKPKNALSVIYSNQIKLILNGDDENDRIIILMMMKHRLLSSFF